MNKDFVGLATFKRMSRNAKDHDIGAVMRSMAMFGFIEPVVINETTGRLIAGHGRVDTLQALKAAGRPAPHGIEVRDGAWFVPTHFAQVDASKEEAASIALNRTSELGGWDEGVLTDILADIAGDEALLLATGYDGNDVDGMLAHLVHKAEDENSKGDKQNENELVDDGSVLFTFGDVTGLVPVVVYEGFRRALAGSQGLAVLLQEMMGAYRQDSGAEG